MAQLIVVSNIDNEIVLVMWFDQNGPDERVYTRTSYFNVYKT